MASAKFLLPGHNWTKLELEIYEKELDNLRCRQSEIETAEEKGLEKGKADGKIEEKLVITRAMLAEGFDVDVIAKVTGLSVDQIKKLK